MRTSVFQPVLAVALVGLACKGPDDLSAGATSFHATLTTGAEATVTPPIADTISTNAAGTATFTVAPGDSVDFTLTISSAFPDSILFAHIHLGAAGVAGGVRLNLCGTGGGLPLCPAHSGTLSGRRTVVAGGITFAALLAAMRSFGAYANVHGSTHGGGEIRGQIIPDAP